jgi:hypothetical protein
MAFRRRVTPIRTRAETLRWGKRQGLGESSHSFHPCGAASARPSRRLSGLSTARIGWTEGHAGAGSNRRGCPGPEFAVLSPLRQLRTAAPRRSERRLPGRPFLAARTRGGGGSRARIGDPETLGRSRVGLPKPVGTDARGTIVHLSAWKVNGPNGLVARGGRAHE